MQHKQTICIFGGTGFIGQHICQELARAGYRLKIVTRFPESAYEIKPYGDVGQIAAIQCNYNDAAAIENAIKGCDGVINLVGILYEKGRNSFKRAHIDIPTVIAKACKKQHIKKFVHISAMGIQKSKSKYAKSKLEGEKEIKQAFPNVTILRPSIVFGVGDSFFNLFAKLTIFMPFLPLIGGGQTKFQPVYVGDIAQSVAKIISAHNQEFEGQTYNLGGPEILSFKQIYQRLFKNINRKKPLISIPWTMAKIQGAILSLAPKPLLTKDQVISLQSDNIIQNGDKTLDDLGIKPTAMETILPRYLSCYKKGGRFGNKKTNDENDQNIKVA
jgi:NADH dehydrogenase